MKIFQLVLNAIINLVRKILAASPMLRSFLYEMRNREEFTDLYEHEKMLADAVRVATYKRAISKYVEPGSLVLDLGTGTGILSCFAAQNNPEKIYAIDHSDFIDIAKMVAKQNNYENIEFIKTHSRSFDPGCKVDVIIHEQMGDYLFNENMIQNLLDLKNRLLKPNGKILPGRFELYVEPVDLKDEFNVPFIWENKVHGVDFSFLANCYEALDKFKPADYSQKWLDADSVKDFLCKPEPVLTIDLSQLKSEKEIPRSFEVEKRVLEAGMFDGFCLYFNAIFDDEINLDTSPLSTYTHWGNCFFRIETRPCFGGEEINFNVSIPDFLDIKTWKVSINTFKQSNSPA